MTFKDIRHAVKCYSSLPNSPVWDEFREIVEDICEEWLEAHPIHDWVRQEVGPVYSAGLLAGSDPLQSPTVVSYWRVCGLIRPKHIPVYEAVQILGEYGIHEGNCHPSDKAISQIAEEHNRNPARLPKQPDYPAMVYWLCRSTYSEHMYLLAHAIARHLIHTDQRYRDMADSIGDKLSRSVGTVSRCRRYLMSCSKCEINDIEDLLKGNPTPSMLNTFTRNEIAKDFMRRYYEYCNSQCSQEENR